MEPKIFVTADQHFGHYHTKSGLGIIVYCKRPFKTIQEHDQYLIDRWNEVVGKHDLVYILGDLCWNRHGHYVMALNGQKILITGSHDKTSQLNMQQFTEVHHGMLVRTINNIPFVMTHCAMKVWERSQHGSVNLYGHSHGRLPEDDYRLQMDVGVDVSPNYAPFPLDFIIYKMSLKKKPEHTRNDKELDRAVQMNKNNNDKLMKQWLAKPQQGDNHVI